MTSEKLNAEVVSVYPDKVKIIVDKLEDFKLANESLKVGSYLRISDNDNVVLIAIIENFSIEVNDEGKRKHIIEANPLGLIKDGEFIRGGDSIAIPPKKVEPATLEEITSIYESSITAEDSFVFSSLASNKDIRIPVNGNKFFNKHIAVIGSTGSGKSYTISTIIRKAMLEKKGDFSLNNSHVIIFDIHSEYKSAFPEANVLDINNLALPYWMLNSNELEEILLDTGERDNYNQSTIFRKVVTENKKKHNSNLSKVMYDTPVFFEIEEISNAIYNLKNETKNSKNSNRFMINDGSYICTNSSTDISSGLKLTENDKIKKYFDKKFDFYPTKNQNITKGDYADGTLDKFYIRFQEKILQDRLTFLFGQKSKTITFNETLSQLMGYDNQNNVTIIDLSGIPFEVLSITVSLISRMLFEYGYYYKRLRNINFPSSTINNDIPLLLVYEEAHKYVPTSNLTKYKAAKDSIERIAKEGRKYGVTLLLASQRPSEISETIFSQCNNFISMRLTNPNDQNYVKKLLPDTLGKLIDSLPSFKAGEALLIGDSIILPSIVQIDPCEIPPSSNDIPYWKLWKEEWKKLDFDKIKDEWYK
jgi:hypothetical protein